MINEIDLLEVKRKSLEKNDLSKALASVGLEDGADDTSVPVRGKIIIVSAVKFRCKFHKIHTYINMEENGIRDKANKMIEFTCDCGTIYKKNL